METGKPKIFISHAWEDKPLVKQLEAELKAAGAEVWVDHSGIRGGDNLPKRISDALGWCNVLILVWSEPSRHSRWVELEWTNAISLGKKIIPCVLNKIQLPPILANKAYISFSSTHQGISQLLLDLRLAQKVMTSADLTNNRSSGFHSQIQSPAKSIDAAPNANQFNDQSQTNAKTNTSSIGRSMSRAVEQFTRIFKSDDDSPNASSAERNTSNKGEENSDNIVEPQSLSLKPQWKRLARFHPSSGKTAGAAKETPLYSENSCPQSDAEDKEIELKSNWDSPNVSSPHSKNGYSLPTLELLDTPEHENRREHREELMNTARALQERLAEFDVDGEVIEIIPGPVITRYEYQPAPGIKVTKIMALADDLALALRKRTSVTTPVPGKSTLGIELQNPMPQLVSFRSIVDTDDFRQSALPLKLALGKTIAGKVYTISLEKMPHLLIAGATGSGKSVFLNTIIANILYKAYPQDVQFVLIDPKRLEFSNYRKLRRHHLNYRDDLKEEVVTTPQNAKAILQSLEWEVKKRYDQLTRIGAKNITQYNQHFKKDMIAATNKSSTSDKSLELKQLPSIVLVIDELADLMLTMGKEIEGSITRLAQHARAVGIHLIVSTQRPQSDVITSAIKASFPARIAFYVTAKIDSRTILDMNGAERLLGNGDMLFLPPGDPEPIRIHGAFISADESERVIEYISRQPYCEKNLLPVKNKIGANTNTYNGESRDNLFNEALKLVVRQQMGSISLLQRKLKIGYSRAARLIDELEAVGIVGSFDGAKTRIVLVNESYLKEMGFE